ncbi:MafI family immunity protein [Promicromonospora iranensis]|uniref:MafI family immunity protein n=1 Tax=Promicromonospora iranensis TaxID=1105144 RepID=UPI0023A9861B|nr:MafI family immunity protein [Promicromonospora iranensis]
MPAIDPDSLLNALITSVAVRVSEPGSDPYGIGMDTLGDVYRLVPATATHADAAYILWAELTDIDDAPRVSAPKLAAELTRLAAREWLDVDTADRNSVSAYFLRWASPMLLTRELFDRPDADCAWRAEYYAYLEREIQRVLRVHDERIPAPDRDATTEYLAVAEYGLALEHITHALSEHEIATTERDLRRLRWITELMGSEHAQRDIATIPVIAD